MTIKAITTADLQQLATGTIPAYLQRFPTGELLQELANRLLYAEKVINDAAYTVRPGMSDRDALDEITADLENYEELKEC